MQSGKRVVLAGACLLTLVVGAFIVVLALLAGGGGGEGHSPSRLGVGVAGHRFSQNGEPGEVGRVEDSVSLEAWALARDPDGWRSILLLERGGEKRIAALVDFVEEWTRADPYEAAAWVALLAHEQGATSHDARPVVEALARSWAAFNTREALEWFARVEDPLFREFAVEASVLVASAEAPGALAVLLEAGGHWPAGMQEAACRTLVAFWAQSDPASCAAWLSGSMIASPEAGRWMSRTLREWGEEDPSAALSYLEDDWSATREEKNRARAALAASWVELNPMTALYLAEQLDEPLRSMRMREAMKWLLLVDPEEAFAVFEALPEDAPERWAMAPAVMMGRSLEDPDAEQDFTGDNLSDEQFNWFYREMLEVWASREPAEALDWVLSVGEDEVAAEEDVQRVIQIWARLDPKAALQAASEYSSDPDLAMEQILTQWSASDLSGAVAFLEERGEAGLEDDEARILAAPVIKDLASVEPEQALVLIREFEFEPDARTVDRMVASWPQEALQRVEAWIGSLPQADGRTSGYRRLAERYMKQDPSRARWWASRLGDPEARDAALEEIRRLEAQWVHGPGL